MSIGNKQVLAAVVFTSGCILLLSYGSIKEAQAAVNVTINNGKLILHGTGAWHSNNVNDPTFPWGSSGNAKYINALRDPKILNVNVSGNNSGQRYVFFNDTDETTGDHVNVNLAENSSVVASVFGNRNHTTDTRFGNVQITGKAGSVITTEMIIGGLSGLGLDPNELRADNNNAVITGPITVKGSDNTIVAGGKGGNAANNSLVIDSADLDLKPDSTTSKIAGGDAANTASSNTLTIKNSKLITADVLAGGYGVKGAQSNKVEITDSTLQTAVKGGYAESGSASNNEVTLSGSAVTGSIYGGHSVNGAADSNTVTILSGSNINGDVYGGYSDSGSASSNTVIISGAPSSINLSQASLNGGNGSGNTLEVNGWSGSVNAINLFNSIALSNADWQNGGAVISANTVQDLSQTDVTLKMHTVQGNPTFDVTIPKGVDPTYMYLIKPQNSAAGSGYQIGQKGWIQSQTLLKRQAGVVKTGNAAFLVVEPKPGSSDNLPPDISSPLPPIDEIFPDSQGTRPNEQITILNDSREASLSFVNQGNDHMISVLDSFSLQNTKGIETFVSTYGQVSKYKGHDSLRIKSASVIAGVGDHFAFNYGSILWGAFAEFGFGSFKTDNNYRGQSLKGNGHIDYSGIGVMARWLTDSGLYVEGGARGGRLRTKLDDGIIDSDNSTISYKSHSYYMSTLAGLGYRHVLKDNTFILGTRYMYGNFEDDTISVGDNKYHFASVNSHRVQLRLGLRHNFSDKLIGRVSLVGEREFVGYTRNRVDGYKSDGKGLQGNIGILGFALLYKKDKNFSLEGRIRGFVGKREGMSARIQANYYWD